MEPDYASVFATGEFHGSAYPAQEAFAGFLGSDYSDYGQREQGPHEGLQWGYETPGFYSPPAPPPPAPTPTPCPTGFSRGIACITVVGVTQVCDPVQPDCCKCVGSPEVTELPPGTPIPPGLPPALQTLLGGLGGEARQFGLGVAGTRLIAATEGGGAGLGRLLGIVALLAGGGYLAWKKWGKKAVAV